MVNLAYYHTTTTTGEVVGMHLSYAAPVLVDKSAANDESIVMGNTVLEHIPRIPADFERAMPNPAAIVLRLRQQTMQHYHLLRTERFIADARRAREHEERENGDRSDADMQRRQHLHQQEQRVEQEQQIYMTMKMQMQQQQQQQQQQQPPTADAVAADLAAGTLSPAAPSNNSLAAPGPSSGVSDSSSNEHTHATYATAAQSVVVAEAQDQTAAAAMAAAPTVVAAAAALTTAAAVAAGVLPTLQKAPATDHRVGLAYSAGDASAFDDPGAGSVGDPVTTTVASSPAATAVTTSSLNDNAGGGDSTSRDGRGDGTSSTGRASCGGGKRGHPTTPPLPTSGPSPLKRRSAASSPTPTPGLRRSARTPSSTRRSN